MMKIELNIMENNVNTFNSTLKGETVKTGTFLNRVEDKVSSIRSMILSNFTNSLRRVSFKVEPLEPFSS